MGWKANAIGRNAKTVREFLEKNWTAEAVDTEEGATKLAVKALLEVVQLGGNLEIAVMRKGDDPKQMKMLPVETIEKYVAEIEEEKEKEAADKTKKKAGSTTDA